MLFIQDYNYILTFTQIQDLNVSGACTQVKKMLQYIAPRYIEIMIALNTNYIAQLGDH